MIKLTPKHVGARVLLSDGEVGFVASHDAQANEYTIKCDSFYFGAEQGDERITLLLDAPNPLDVPVPAWCAEVVVWQHDETVGLVHAESLVTDPSFDGWGWSPAPGQMPPRGA